MLQFVFFFCRCKMKIHHMFYLIDETKKINNQLIKNCNKEVNKTFSKAIKLHSCVLILNVTYEG